MYDPLRNGRRKEDKNILAKVAAVTIKYHWLASLLLIVFLAFGFDFRTPADLFGEIRDEIELVKTTAVTNKDIAKSGLDTVKAEMDAAFKERYALKTLLESSVVAQCLYYPKNISRTAGLPCARLFRERGIE
jgi:hypothetical protein